MRLERPLTRRSALALVAALVPAPLLGLQRGGGGQLPDSQVLPLMDPYRAGRPRARVTDYENDPFIVGVEQQLRCTCGCNLSVYTCRTTDFTCTVSPQLHGEVIALVEDGKTAEEILDAFVARYGEVVLMAPRKEGFNLAGYVVPGIAITLVGGAMAWVLTRRTARAAASEAAGAGTLSPEDAARLEAELSQLER